MTKKQIMNLTDKRLIEICESNKYLFDLIYELRHTVHASEDNNIYELKKYYTHKIKDDLVAINDIIGNH